MAEATLRDSAVLLVGDADPSLMEASVDAFLEAGARVALAAESAPSGVVPATRWCTGVVALPAHDAGDAGAAALVRDAAARLGGLDVLVRLCQARPGPSLLEADPAVWQAEAERILQGAVRLGGAAARAMAGLTGGSLVFVGSVDALHAYPGRSAASVAMSGLLGLVRAMGIELAGVGVRANAVIVGPLGDERSQPPAGADAALVQRTRLRSPMHRWAAPAEVAAAIRFVAGPEAAFMTGQTLRVDGGWASLNQAPEGMRFS